MSELVESEKASLSLYLGHSLGRPSFTYQSHKKVRKRFLGSSQDHIGQKFCKMEPENLDM